MLGNLTPEQRAEALKKAQAARIEKQKAGEHLKQDWLDESHWRVLASKYGIRLPASYLPNSDTKYLKRICTKLGIDIREYVDYCGCRNLKELVKMNPSYPAWVETCFMLEWYDERSK